MSRFDKIKCIDSKGKTRYIVEKLAFDATWMRSKEIRLFPEIEKPVIPTKIVEVITGTPIIKETTPIDPFEVKPTVVKKTRAKRKK